MQNKMKTKKLHENPNPNSVMTQHQLIDSLTSHISLYHNNSSQNPNPNPRSSIFKWFSSLSLHHRRSHLTVVDPNFVRILLQMLRNLRANGNGRFIILPDIPSGDNLPSLCYKRSRGLISRVSESNESERLIFDSVLLFGAKQGERIEDCSCSANRLDSLTVTEDFVGDLDRFFETMDEVTNGGFLRGEEGDLGSDWVELDWLKAKGYYSFEAFVANRLEVSLRLAWLNCNGGKKRGVKLKEKLNAAAMAANVFWRKQRCADWWTNLDGDVRRKAWRSALGKAAKPLTFEVMREANCALEDEMWLFGFGKKPARGRYTKSSLSTASAFSAHTNSEMTIEPSSLSSKPRTLANICNRLCVLQDIVSLILSCQHSEFSVQNVFFSSLASLSTPVDCILRKVRGFLMVISTESSKIELLEAVDCKYPANTSKEKLGLNSRKKKGKSLSVKKPNPVQKSDVDKNLLDKTVEKHSSGLDCNKNKDFLESNKSSSTSHVKDNCAKEHVGVVVVEKGETIGKKSRKQKNKKKGKTAAAKNCSERSVMEASSSSTTIPHEIRKFDEVSGSSLLQSVTSTNLSGNAFVEPNQSACSSTSQLPVEAVNSKIIGEENSSCSFSESHPLCMDSNQSLTDAVKIQSSRGGGNTKIESNVTSEDVSLRDSCHRNESEEKSMMPNGRSEEISVIEEQKKGEAYDTASTSTSEFFSYEWPAVSPVYFSSVNGHLPTATDRLHLDVGHNLHAYIRQPFVPSVHHARNPSVEGGCKQVLSRPTPMSLDWPPMVRSNCRLTTSLACNYDSGVFIDCSEQTNMREQGNECDNNNWMSEEESEIHTVTGMDYNQYFGGGVMYWNPSDHLGTTGFSRPPSLSSDDSSWAWHEAEMKRAVDDMVAFSSSYSTNGLTSPTAASFCSPFDPLVSGKVLQAEAKGEEDVSGSLASLSADMEGNSGDSFSYPILRPIIIPRMSRERSKSEFKRGYDLKSPHVPPRREQSRIKRPPSPVVLCVPRAPCPPPPSPVSDSRTRRGIPTVRSGSSSPRHLGMRGWFHDGINWEEACGAEVVWPWRNKNLSVRPIIQPLPGALLQDHLLAMSQLARDQEHPDVAFPLQPPELVNCPTRAASLSFMHNLLSDEIDYFCRQVAAENMARKPYINWAVKRVTRSLQVLWPRSRTNIFGSNATGLSLPSSDVDLVVCLPPVRNLEPIKEAGILEGRNGIKETCLQHAARYLANQEWVKTDSLKTVENTAIPIIMLVVEVPCDLGSSAPSNMHSPKEDSTCIIVDHCNGDMVGFEEAASPKCRQTNYGSLADVKSVRLDISFKTPSHTGLQTTELVKDLTEQFPAATPLALVLKQFLADRSLDQSYSGGLSSYCLVLLITRFLQHEHHLGRPLNQVLNFGSLLMDFLYFFGNVFDPRQMRVSVQGSGVYRNRERGYSIDPIHIDDPLFPTNNVGRNCFRIHQCIKAFSEAYSILENELTRLPSSSDSHADPPCKLLPKIIPSTSS